jgi:hypothetical protein
VVVVIQFSGAFAYWEWVKMSCQFKELEGCSAIGTDEVIGIVTDLLLDRQLHAIRYLVVETTSGVPGRRLLVSPRSVRYVNTHQRQIQLAANVEIATNCVPVTTRSTSPDETDAVLPSDLDEQLYWAPANTEQEDFAQLDSATNLLGLKVEYADESTGCITDVEFDADRWQVRKLVLLAPHLLRRNSQVVVAPEDVVAIDRGRRRLRTTLTAKDATAAPTRGMC